jgi:hypothetical protein
VTTRLKIYNNALLICGERQISSLTENREPRYLLDNVWDDDGVNACLEEAYWKFATRTVQLDYDPDVTIEFGYSYAFELPSDWVHTASVCSDEYFQVPLTQYSHENGFIYADITPIYVKYISDGASYGNDLSIWPKTFADFVAGHFASRIIYKITTDKEKREAVKAERAMLLKRARSRDAANDPTKFPPEGSWTSSRRRGSVRERGNRNNLTG